MVRPAPTFHCAPTRRGALTSELSDIGRLLLERLAPLQDWADRWAAGQRRP